MDLVRGCEFWRDGCRTMARAVCATSKLAGEPTTPGTIVRFQHSLPRKPEELGTEAWQKGYCSGCLERAQVALEAPDRGRVTDYFLRYFPGRWWTCQVTMIDGFVGLLDGIYWEEFRCRTHD
jgi:hypothetical protein